MKFYLQRFFTLACFAVVLFSCRKDTESPAKTIKIKNYKIEGNVYNNNIIKAVAIDKSGRKWFGTDGGGLSKFNGIEWTHFSKNDGLLSNNIQSLTIDSQNNLWISYGFNKGGVSKFNGYTWYSFFNPNGPGNGTVFTIKQDSRGNYYFGTYGGVSMYDNLNWWIFHYYPEGGPSVESIDFDKQGNVWLGLGNHSGLSGGVTVVSESNTTKYTVDDGLVSNRVSCIAIDSKNNKWIGTDGDGVSKFDGTNWITYNEQDGLVSNKVNTIAIDSDDNIWFGTSNGVSMFNGKTWLTYNKSNGLSGNFIHSIAFDGDGHIWIGTSEGITELFYE